MKSRRRDDDTDVDRGASAHGNAHSPCAPARLAPAFAKKMNLKYYDTIDRPVFALLEVAERDKDFVVRAVAVKAIGRFEGRAAFARERLARIAANDPELAVRREAERVLKRLEK